MDKKILKLVIIAVPMLMIISALSGCVDPNAIQTKHWDHINSDGTGVRIWGFLKLGQNFKNWDAYFVYDTEFHDDYLLYKNRIEADNYDNFNFFSVDVYGLDRTTEYHYRAIGEQKQAGGNVVVGLDHTFIPGGPRVNVINVSTLGTTSARLEGDLTHMGGASNCDVFFKYGSDPQNLNMETIPETKTMTGNFHADITDLSSCETYYYRAYASNDADTWQSIWQFQLTPGRPTVETYMPQEVTSTTAKFRGKLFLLGGTPDTDIWFEYGDDNPNNLDETTGTINMDDTGEFNIVADGLTPATTYWVRAVANNGVCEHKGKIQQFNTLSPLGEVIETDTTDDSDQTITTIEKGNVKPMVRILKEKYPFLEEYKQINPALNKIFD